MRRTRPTLIAAVAVGAIIALFVVLLASRPSGTRVRDSAPIEGKPAPPVNGKVVSGERFEIAETDEWVLVNFFATWCVPCVKEHPELVEFERNHREAGDGRVISVVYDQDPKVVRRFFEDNGGDWTVVDADEGRTAVAWGVTGVPESYLVSPTGIVVQRIRGGVTAAELDAIIDAYRNPSEEQR